MRSMMLSTNLLKRLATGLLLLSLALPSFTCAGYEGPDGRRVSGVPTGADPASYRAARVPHYPLGLWTPREGAFWIVLLAFTWPIPILALRRRAGSRIARLAWWIEPVCAVAGGWMIWQVATLGRPASGTYVALTATGILIATWATEAWRAVAARSSPATLRASPF